MKILRFVRVLRKAIFAHDNGAEIVKVHQSISAKDLLFLCGVFTEIRGNEIIAKNSRTRHEGIPSLSYFENPEYISYLLFYLTLAQLKHLIGNQATGRGRLSHPVPTPQFYFRRPWPSPSLV